MTTQAVTDFVMEAVQLATDILIKPFEGYHKKLPDGGCKAYPDPGTGGKPWTIGWGCTGPHINPDTVWTMEQAETELRKEVMHFAYGLLKLSPSLARATPIRFAVMISFAFNCGLGNYRISTLKRCVDRGDWEGAKEQIVRWNKAAGRVLPGLTRRRLAEAALL